MNSKEQIEQKKKQRGRPKKKEDERDNDREILSEDEQSNSESEVLTTHSDKEFMLKLMNEIKSMRVEMRDLNKNLSISFRKTEQELKDELREVKNIFGDVLKELDILRDEKNKIKMDILDLKENYRAKTESMRDRIDEMQERSLDMENELNNQYYRMVEIEQYNRRNNIEIHGVTYRDEEDCELIVKKIVENLELEIGEEDIEAAHRLKSNKDEKGNIIVKFSNRKIRDKVMENKRKCSITNKMIDIIGEGEDRKIFLNENLCYEKKRLFNEALRKKRELEWKFIWTVNGNIKMKKDENSKIIEIRFDRDLDKINNRNRHKFSNRRPIERKIEENPLIEPRNISTKVITQETTSDNAVIYPKN